MNTVVGPLTNNAQWRLIGARRRLVEDIIARLAYETQHSLDGSSCLLSLSELLDAGLDQQEWFELFYQRQGLIPARLLLLADLVSTSQKP